MECNLPSKKGCLDIFPEIHHGQTLNITVMGDPDGLRYLADLLNYLADFNQDDNSDPVGNREHIHLSPECQLGEHSCQVELCRADAKGTGQLPDFMRDSEG